MSDNFTEQNDIRDLAGLLRHRAESRPDKTAYIFLTDGETEEVKLTYAELDQQAKAIAAELRKTLEPGDRALMLYPPGMEFIPAFFGCLYAGVVAVPCYPPDPNKLAVSLAKLEKIIADCQPRVIMTTREFLDLAAFIFPDYPDLEKMNWLASDGIDRSSAESWTSPELGGEHLAFLQYTSGSTGDPKGVMVSHANILHNEEIINQFMGHSEGFVAGGWIPFFHDMGLIGHIIQPLYMGGKSVLMSPIAFLQKPLRWLRMISRYRINTSAAPNFAYKLCADKATPDDLKTLDLSCWKMALNGAEPVRAETMRHFAEVFEPCGFSPETFYPAYGMAEATLIISGGSLDAPPVYMEADKNAIKENRVIDRRAGDEDAQTLVGCGKSHPDQKVIVVDPESLDKLEDNLVGEIWVSGPSVTQGYWNKPDMNRSNFQARTSDGEGPFLRTEDMGFLRDGELFITGRLKDMIIIRGQNYYPQDIELTAEQSHPALRPGCSAAFSVEEENEERLVVVQEVRAEALENQDMDEVIEAIRLAVAEKYELMIYALVLIKPKSIYKTSSGKIQRSACRKAFLEDKLEAVEKKTMNITQGKASTKQSKGAFILQTLTATEEAGYRHFLLTAYLKDKIAASMDVDVSMINAEKPIIAQTGMDSLKAVEFRSSLEEELGELELNLSSLLQGLNIEKLARDIDEQLSGRGFTFQESVEIDEKKTETGAI